MSSLLMAYEKDCQTSRRTAPDLSACLMKAHRQIGQNPDPVFAKVNTKIIDLLEADANPVEHAYHNRHHVCDVVCAVVLFLKQTDLNPDAPARVVECMITAALGHDLHHDGLGTMSALDVERRSAKAVLAIGQEEDLPAADLALIEGLILATYPPVQRALRQTLGIDPGPGANDVLALMFGEADVLASLTPTFGKVLSIALSAEWRKAGLLVPSMPDEDAGRALFLSAYRRVTPTAQRLGVDVMVSDQLQNLQRKVS